MNARTAVRAARSARILLLAALLVPGGARVARATVPTLFNYQGYLTDGAGSPRQGGFKMKFTLYADSLTGTALWSETYASVPVTNGVFNVLLGTVNALPDSQFTGAKLWLETAVSDTTLAPRRALVTVPYSFHARSADTAMVALAFGSHVTGQVSNSCSSSVGGVLVYIPGHSFVAYTDSLGNFDLASVPPGTYTVHIESAATSQSFNIGSVTVAANANTSVGVIALGANTQTDPNNCGTCGHVCSTSNATEACVAGNCQVTACAAGYADCDQNPNNGCEVNLQTSASNCGSCGNACPSGPNAFASCSSGTCQLACLSGYANCNGNPSDGCETNIASDVNNCGACGQVCSAPNATMACSNGSCMVAACSTGYANCDANPFNGCEVNLMSDSSNCGACGHACPSGHACVSGVCQ